MYRLRRDQNHIFKSLAVFVWNNGTSLADTGPTRQEVNGVLALLGKISAEIPSLQQRRESLES